jgi:uncharacterized protein (TIGR02246 family)
MKKYLCAVSLVLLLFFVVACQKQGEEVAAEPAVDIEAEKQAVAERFQALVDASVAGDIEKWKSFFHPEMRWWDFSQKNPVGIEDYTKFMEDFYKSGLKWVCELGPFEIHIVGKMAVLYTTYKNIFKDPKGSETISSGPWTAVLVKQEGKWMFLSNIFAPK